MSVCEDYINCYHCPLFDSDNEMCKIMDIDYKEDSEYWKYENEERRK